MLLLQLCVQTHIHTCGPINDPIPATHTFQCIFILFVFGTSIKWLENWINLGSLFSQCSVYSILCFPYLFHLGPYFSVFCWEWICFSSHLSKTIVKVWMIYYFVSLVIWGHGTIMCHYIFMASSCFCIFILNFVCKRFDDSKMINAISIDLCSSFG